jgi:L-lactate permease
MLVDVFIQWKLTSETVMFQNVIALLLFPIFVWYLLQFTYKIKKIHRVWYVLLFPVLIFCVLSIIDHYVLLKYTTHNHY